MVHSRCIAGYCAQTLETQTTVHTIVCGAVKVLSLFSCSVDLCPGQPLYNIGHPLPPPLNVPGQQEFVSERAPRPSEIKCLALVEPPSSQEHVKRVLASSCLPTPSRSINVSRALTARFEDATGVLGVIALNNSISSTAVYNRPLTISLKCSHIFGTGLCLIQASSMY